MKLIKLVALLACFASASAFATTINFEGEPLGPVAGETLVMNVDGVTVTITGAGLQIRTLNADFEAQYGLTHYLSTTGDSQQITVTFSGAYADYVTILNPINGTVTAEVDTITGNAYDGADVNTDTVTSSDELLTLNGPGIARVTYDDEGTGYVIGYIEFNATAGLGGFRVTKTFSDGSTDEVNVHLTCNSGVPLEQDFTIAGGDPAGVTFVVQDIPDGGANCEVTESGGPAGYTPVLNGGDGCAWEGVTGGLYTCEITNEANPATFTVNKEWLIENGSASDVNEVALVTVYCNNEIVGGTWNGSAYQYSTWLDGDDSVDVTVDTTQQSAQCYAAEEVNQTGIESDDDCGSRTIAAGDSSSCTFTNTVFFEGIPTLSQWGLAILAVLTLGVGLVGFRRFA